tara:strand:- start:7 stop:918 length:912 start_codon:yes stop_codon:yes gene_type:complete
VQVYVYNGTLDEKAAGITVTVQIFLEDNETYRVDAVSDTDGNITLSIPGDQASESTIIASVLYKEVRYFSEVIFLSSDETTGLKLAMYEPTNNSDSISISSESAIVFQQPTIDSLLHVVQIITYENSSRETFVGSNPDTKSVLHIPLPPMAFDVQNVSEPGSLQLDPVTNQLYSTAPALPGKNEIVVSYKCLYTGDTFIWSKSFKYPHQNIVVALPSRFEIGSNMGWISMPTQEINEESYTRYALSGPPEESNLSIIDLPLSKGAKSKSLHESIRTITTWSIISILLVFLLQMLLNNKYWKKS